MNTAARHCLIALEIMLLLWPLSAYSRVWYVRNDGTGDAPTIQAAVDSSGAGDSILVASGIYDQGAVFIVSKDNLTIQSEQGAGQTVLWSPVLLEDSSDITFEGFTCESSGQGEGIRAYRSTHLVLQRNIFRHEAGAIVLDWSTDVTVRWNVIYSNADGVYCMDLASGVSLYGNTIAHNTGIGFSADDINYTLENNIIAYNKIGVFSTVGSFTCNDVYGNETDYVLFYVPDPTGTAGNMSVPPLFCGVDPATSGNYYLQQNSPCVPPNHPDGYGCDLIGRYGIGCQDDEVRKASWGGIKSIFR